MTSVKRIDFVAVTVILAVAALVLLPLHTPGLPNPGDFLMSVHRLDELADAWRKGIYFPRFGPNLNFGYSAPLFQFYPPLASYLGLLISIFGLDHAAALKLLMAIALMVGGGGVYVYAQFLYRQRLAATLSGVFYVTSPYLITVIFERGAVAESLAWAILPWMAWSAHSFYTHGRPQRGLILALSVALTLTAHIATAMFLVPGVLLYVVILALLERRQTRIWSVAARFVLGVGMSAFYWLPAIGELGLTQTQEIMLNGATATVNNLVAIPNLFQHTLMHAYTETSRFHFSLWQMLVGLLGILWLSLKPVQRATELWLWAVAWGVVVVLQTGWSAAFWQYMPFVDFIQFPWRLYGVASFCVALLGGIPFAHVNIENSAQRVLGFVAVAAFTALSLWFSLANLLPVTELPLWTALDDAALGRMAMWERGRYGYPLFDDYTLETLTIGSIGLTTSRAPDDTTILPPTTVDYIEIISANPTRYVLWAEAAQPWTLRLHRPYFPGWQVYQNGERVSTHANGTAGLVTAQISAGAHKVVATFGESTLRLIADLLTTISLALWIVLWLPLHQRLRQTLAVAGLVTAMAATTFYVSGPGKPGQTPYPYHARFANQLMLLAYGLTDTRLCVGNEATLRLYWFVGKTPNADLKYFIHLVQPDDTGRVAQFDTQPFAGFNPTTRWEAGEFLVDEQTLVLGAVIPPGRYSLLVGLYDPTTLTNQQVLTAPDILPGDRLRLTDIELVDCTP